MARKFTSVDYRVMPWKNGGGTTTELYVEPTPGAPFLWRVSIADIASDGPFSTFENYDRHIMAIEGCGMVLEGGPHGPIEVNPRFVVRSFSGDWPITSRLLSGPVRDFNLMARREAAQSTLTCAEVTAPLRLGGVATTTFAYVLEGGLEADDQILGEGDGLLLTVGEAALAAPSGPSCRLALCRIKLSLRETR